MFSGSPCDTDLNSLFLKPVAGRDLVCWVKGALFWTFERSGELLDPDSDCSIFGRWTTADDLRGDLNTCSRTGILFPYCAWGRRYAADSILFPLSLPLVSLALILLWTNGCRFSESMENKMAEYLPGLEWPDSHLVEFNYLIPLRICSLSDSYARNAPSEGFMSFCF